MTNRIVIDPVTRIEGHAKITIDVDDAGRVADAHFHIVEFRGFEKLCEGRPIDEMPAFMARVCGLSGIPRDGLVKGGRPHPGGGHPAGGRSPA